MRAVVVGGGFRGIVSAYLLAQAGHLVELFERAPFLGSVLHSPEWDGLFVDNGCHLFDNSDDETTRICLDILGQDGLGISVRYNCLIAGQVREGLTVPDLSVLPADQQALMLYEAVEAAARPDAWRPSLAECLEARFGGTAARVLRQCCHKKLKMDAKDLDPEALAVAGMQRVRLVSDSLSRVLKQAPSLDERLAVSSQDDPMQHYRTSAGGYPFRNFYPRGKGMRTFCESARARLLDMGVVLHLGTSVNQLTLERTGVGVHHSNGCTDADVVVWAQDLAQLQEALEGSDELSRVWRGVPLLLYHFRVAGDHVGLLDYYHDYNSGSLVFRGSTPGRYGQQFDAQGYTYVTAEVPVTTPGCETWENAEDLAPEVWGELVWAGIASGPLPEQRRLSRISTSYRVPLIGMTPIRQRFAARIERWSSKLFAPSSDLFAKVTILDDVRRQLTRLG